MSKNPRRKKLFNVLSNLILGLIILTLIIPGWRIKFQSFVQGLLMSETTLQVNVNQKSALNNPDWYITNGRNETFRFEDLKGKPIVLNFWATWCPACLAELPELKSLYNEISDEVHIICISTEDKKTIREKNFFELYGNMIHVAQGVPESLSFAAYPTTFILDRNLNIVSKIEGAYRFNSPENY